MRLAGLVALSLLLTVAVIACSSKASPPRDDLTPTPGAGRTGAPIDLVRPPATTARNGGVSVTMGTGTSCWSAPGGPGACIDMAGPVTSPTPLAVSHGARIDVANPVPGTAIRQASVTAAAASGQPQQLSGGELAWPFPARQGQQLASTVDAAGVHFAADLVPGRYVVSVFVVVPQGDVSYGLLLEVRQ